MHWITPFLAGDAWERNAWVMSCCLKQALRLRSRSRGRNGDTVIWVDDAKVGFPRVYGLSTAVEVNFHHAPEDGSCPYGALALIINQHRDGNIGFIGPVGQAVSGEPGMRVGCAALGSTGFGGDGEGEACKPVIRRAARVFDNTAQGFLDGRQVRGCEGRVPFACGWKTLMGSPVTGWISSTNCGR